MYITSCNAHCCKCMGLYRACESWYIRVDGLIVTNYTSLNTSIYAADVGPELFRWHMGSRGRD